MLSVEWTELVEIMVGDPPKPNRFQVHGSAQACARKAGRWACRWAWLVAVGASICALGFGHDTEKGDENQMPPSIQQTFFFNPE